MNREDLRTIIADQLTALLKKPSEAEVPRQFDLLGQLKYPEVTVLMGVRRCGKSTLLRQLARALQGQVALHYLNFEEQRLSRFTVDDFQSAYEEFLVTARSDAKQVLIYDEVQLVVGWERWVAGLSSREQVKVFVTGSNSFMLSSELASLLTGRHLPLHITPFSFSELVAADPEASPINSVQRATTAVNIRRRQIFEDFQKFGGFPRAVASRDIAILGQYYEDIVQKDIALRKGVRNVVGLKQLGSLLASQNTRLFNQSAVAKELGIKSSLTIGKFCDYFKETYLYSEIRQFSRSKRQQLRGRAKFYAVDPLMAKESGFHHTDSEYWILENHVCNELLRRRHELFYWNSREGYEVDFIARRRDGIYEAIQVAVSLRSRETLERELRALACAKRDLEITRRTIITRDDQDNKNLQVGDVNVVPFYRWALEGLAD